MYEIVGLVYVLICIGYLYIAYKRFGQEEKDVLYIAGCPIGHLISKDQLHKMVSKASHNKLSKIYSVKNYEEGLRRFQYSRFGLVIILIMFGGLFSIILGQDYIPSTSVDYQIERPEFGGEGNESYTLKYEVIDGEKVLQGQLPVDINEQFPSSEKALLVLETKSDLLYELILGGDNPSSDKVLFDLTMPSKPFVENIEVAYRSLNKDVINDKGQLRKNLMVFDHAYEASIEVILTFGESELIKVYDFIVYKQLPSLDDEVKTIEDQIVESDNQLVLPEKTVYGENKIIWKTIEEGISTSQILLLTIILGLVFYVLKEEELNRKIVERQDEILFDFPNVVNKLTILMNAGMTFSRAWFKIVDDYKRQNGKMRVLYEEMLQVQKDLQMGVSEADAIEAFGKRCRNIEVIRLSSILVQNLRRGSHSLTIALKELSVEAWSIRTSNARKLGEKASTKLLIPMAISLFTVLLIVIAPTFMKMQL